MYVWPGAHDKGVLSSYHHALLVLIIGMQCICGSQYASIIITCDELTIYLVFSLYSYNY